MFLVLTLIFAENYNCLFFPFLLFSTSSFFLFIIIIIIFILFFCGGGGITLHWVLFIV